MTDDGTPMTASQLTKKERMAILRHDMLEQDPEIRAHNFDEVNLGYALEIARQEAERCLQCPKEYCIEGCPVAVNIPRFISYLRDGDVHAAAESLLGDNALPCVTGRVCPQETQCEQVCLRAKTGRPVAIGYLERFVADWAQAHNGELAHATPRATQKKVAIVGSGPAGLTAAGELARRGHAVTVYEAFHAAGGVLLYGIPEFRLPKSVVQREVDRLVAAGVTIEPNAIIGKTYTLAELRESFDAIFVAVGAGLPVFMNVPGENLKGVLSANEYLTRVNLMGAWNPDSDTPVLHGQRVVVVGGGNVAMDSVRTARRLGAAEARICYRRSRDELPARAEEVHHAEQEGVIFDLLVAPLEVLGDERGWVRGLRCQREATQSRHHHEGEGGGPADTRVDAAEQPGLAARCLRPGPAGVHGVVPERGRADGEEVRHQQRQRAVAGERRQHAERHRRPARGHAVVA